VFRVGERPGHYQAFLRLIRNMPLWRETHAVYPDVRVPVHLVYGDHDWSHGPERKATAREIPGATWLEVQNGGHFLPLDQPESVIHEIRSFASEPSRPSNGR
jgi:pimeloyl-ACP methyl ester carboxylesterase